MYCESLSKQFSVEYYYSYAMYVIEFVCCALTLRHFFFAYVSDSCNIS